MWFDDWLCCLSIVLVVLFLLVDGWSLLAVWFVGCLYGFSGLIVLCM